jgi:hypothetical protein
MNRLEWILGIFLVVLLLIVLGLAIMLWTQPRGGEPPAFADRPAAIAPATPVFVGKTAQTAFAQAEARAQEWQADAMLLRADATWPPGLLIGDVLDGASSWSFVFYSPSQGAIRQVTVIEESVTLLAERNYQPPQPLQATSDWTVDSNTAVQYFMTNGGQEFMRQVGSTVLTMSLRMDKPDGRIIWSVSSVATDSARGLIIDIDARTGDVLEVINANQ